VFRRREKIRERLIEIVEKSHQKGALSPEKAMTAQELAKIAKQLNVPGY